MKVDICSIMYNEEVMLPMWIESWLSVPWIDRINLVDGGSTDKSVEIAKSYGDRVNVFVVPWRGDFSRQRNIALGRTKALWVIQPDIDEIPIGNLMHSEISLAILDKNLDRFIIPYVKFYDWKTLWFFRDGNRPKIDESNEIFCGAKSTIEIFRKKCLSGYSKSLHEEPMFQGNSSRCASYCVLNLDDLNKHFVVGHYDQAKHFEQSKRNKTSVELEMGLKRVRYRLISPASYDGKVYDKQWAEKALSEYNNGNVSMIEELGAAQLKSFKDQHVILDEDVFDLNNEFVKKHVK